MASVVPTVRNATTGRSLRLSAALLLAVTAALALVLTAGAAPATRPTGQPATGPARQGVTATAILTGNAALPTPVDTSLPALPVQTGQAPGPVGTFQPGAIPPGGTDTNTGGQPAPTPAPAATADSSGLPSWLWIIAGLLLLAIAGGAAYMFTRRPAAPAAVTPAAPPAPVAPPPPAAPLATTARVTPPEASVAAPVPATAEMPTAVLPVAAAAAAPVIAAPTMVKCPNCDTMNPIDRRYCDECGQDLRSAVAAAMAGTLPEVEATTPYLETLSRADEQLEFVLARDLITVGRGLDNDIVIDDQFIGWQTVSPRHAELRRGPTGFVLRDMNSENGTFVNSSRTGENVLEDGMTIAFGKVEFIYRVPAE
jgi:hypothetical protein